MNTLPATCELCGNWLPGHSSTCPRNGVHPSQWSLSAIDEQERNNEYNIMKSTVHDDYVDFGVYAFFDYGYEDSAPYSFTTCRIITKSTF